MRVNRSEAKRQGECFDAAFCGADVAGLDPRTIPDLSNRFYSEFGKRMRVRVDRPALLSKSTLPRDYTKPFLVSTSPNSE